MEKERETMTETNGNKGEPIISSKLVDDATVAYKSTVGLF
jgi:hypothetical protein